MCINLALLTLESDRREEGIKLLDCCYEHMKNEWVHGMYRYYNLYYNLSGKKNFGLLKSPEERMRKYYCEIPFEPWLINFSHE